MDDVGSREGDIAILNLGSLAVRLVGHAGDDGFVLGTGDAMEPPSLEERAHFVDDALLATG